MEALQELSRVGKPLKGFGRCRLVSIHQVFTNSHHGEMLQGYFNILLLMMMVRVMVTMMTKRVTVIIY